MYEQLPAEVNRVASIAVNAAYEVHKRLGPGLLERVYQVCLMQELRMSGRTVICRKKVPIIYRGIILDDDLQLDILINGCLIIELKTVEAVHPVHKAQLLSYMRLSGIRLGLLINFNVALIKDGIYRMIL